MKPPAFGPQLDLEIPAATLAYTVQYLPHSSIAPDPEQPRKEPDAELIDSIRANGILQPITVRRHPERVDGTFMIIDGERRWRGAAGILAEVPVIVREDLDDRAQRLQTQLVANVGKPLDPLEEAEAFAELMPHHESIASLARALGRPERTVGERLQLLELGPWLAKLRDGSVPLSHAVRVLLPLRGCPDDVHAGAIARVEKDWRVSRGGEGGASLGDLERAVREAYKPAMYPLTKTKASYDKQPTFDTRRHDEECECGRISFALIDAKRACCGNPSWWRSRHRKAQAEAPKPKTRSGGGVARERRPLTFHLPAGAKQVKAPGFGQAPAGYVLLTDHQGRWDPFRLAFDPTTLTPEPAQLALVAPGVSGDVPRVAVKAEAVVAARAKWEERWTGRQQGLVGALQRKLKEKGSEYRVSGPGVGELLARVDGHDANLLRDAAVAQGIELPKGLAAIDLGFDERRRAIEWIASLDENAAAKVATAAAYLLGTRTPPPSEKVVDEIRQAMQAITKKPVPWAKAPKGAKGKGTTAAVVDDVDEADEEDVDDDE